MPSTSAVSTPAAVLFDRDGTLVHDVPYNNNPDLVRPVTGAADALHRLRGAGILLGIVSNQSGVASGRLRPAEVEAVHGRVVDLLGPFDVIRWCPHGPDDGCDCRKPQPGLVLQAAAAVGVPAGRCVVIGDTGADVGAGLAAGARAVLIPNSVTRPEEIESAPVVAPNLGAAIDDLLGHRR